ncbi:MAG: TIM barrel protein [Planctomycetota bacterium]
MRTEVNVLWGGDEELRQAFTREDIFRDHATGYERARIVDLSHHISVRENRYVCGEYHLTRDGYLEARYTDDTGPIRPWCFAYQTIRLARIAAKPRSRVGAIGTGWLGSQRLDAPTAIRALGPKVQHVHFKDVAAPGGHETVPRGTGCVDLEGAIAAVRDIGYTGDYSWEDEPENRNPFDIAADMRLWIADHIA